MPDTIPPDVSKPEDEKKEEKPRYQPKRRDEAQAAIAKRRQKERDDVPRETSEVETKEVPDETKETPAETAPEPIKEDLVEIKVDGQTQKVEREKALEAGIRALQKESAADKRLKEAADIKRQAEELLAKAKPEIVEESDEDLVELAKTIQVGEPEEAAEALKKLKSALKPQPSTPMDEGQLSAIVDSRMEFKDALSAFKKDFSWIWNDPYLQKQAGSLDDELLADDEFKNAPPSERFKEIGKRMTEWRDSLVKTDTETRAEKKQRKQETQTPTGASARQITTTPPEDKPKDKREVIADMRAARRPTI